MKTTKPFSREEEDLIRSKYENGETFGAIAKELGRSRSGVQNRYNKRLGFVQSLLEDDIKVNASITQKTIAADTYSYALQHDAYYGVPNDPGGQVCAKEWAAKQQVLVATIWDHGPLPPISAYEYSPTPTWPASTVESSRNAAGNEITPRTPLQPVLESESTADLAGKEFERETSSQSDSESESSAESADKEPTPANPSRPESKEESTSDAADKGITPPDPLLESKAESSLELASQELTTPANEPLAQLPDSTSEDQELAIQHEKAIGLEKLIADIQHAQKAAMRALETKHEAEMAVQKSLIEFYKGQADRQEHPVMEKEVAKALEEQKGLADLFKNQANQHERRVKELESEKEEWVGEKQQLEKRIEALERQNEQYDRENAALVNELDRSDRSDGERREIRQTMPAIRKRRRVS